MCAHLFTIFAIVFFTSVTGKQTSKYELVLILVIYDWICACQFQLHRPGVHLGFFLGRNVSGPWSAGVCMQLKFICPHTEHCSTQRYCTDVIMGL